MHSLRGYSLRRHQDHPSGSWGTGIVGGSYVAREDVQFGRPMGRFLRTRVPFADHHLILMPSARVRHSCVS